MNNTVAGRNSRFILGLLAWASLAAHAFAADVSTLDARPGDLIEARLGELHPTQAVLGKAQIYYTLGRYRSDKGQSDGRPSKRFEDWCEARGQGAVAWADADARLDQPASFACSIAKGRESAENIAAMKTVVVGPGGQLYLTDGHHSFTAFLESADGGPDLRVRVRVQDNLGKLSPAEFWQTMQAQRRVWLRDENDRPISPGQLPERLGMANFGDDRYRSLVYFTRDIGYTPPALAPEFLEFYWGSWLRRNGIAAGASPCDTRAYLRLVKQASQRMVAQPDDTLLAGSLTAAAAGKLAQWNNGKKDSAGEFGKLGRSIDDAKPGKLAYVANYQAGLVAACQRALHGKKACRCEAAAQ